jgi:hypothetical protein
VPSGPGWGNNFREVAAVIGRARDGCSLVDMTETTARGRVRVEPSQKRVRAYFAGDLVADTTHPLLVWEIP